jgi:CHAT domain-containing protein
MNEDGQVPTDPRHALRIVRQCAFILIFGIGPAPSFAQPDGSDFDKDFQTAIASGDRYFLTGRIEHAIERWTHAYELAEQVDGDSERILALAKRAEAYQALGFYQKARTDLTTGIALAEEAGDRATRARLQGSLGNVLFLSGDSDASEDYLRACLAYARDTDTRDLEARTLNNLGNLLASRQMPGAEEAFDESYELARQLGDDELAAVAMLNAARARMRRGDLRVAEQQTLQTLDAFRALPESSARAAGLVRAGRLLQRIDRESPADNGQRLQTASEVFQEAVSLARTLNDHRVLSYALGYLGQIYEVRERFDEALTLSYDASFAAQMVEAEEIQYLWQWQIGRIHREKSQPALALVAYRQAVGTLQRLRHRALNQPGSSHLALQRDASKVFRELTDLLLTQSDKETSRETVEAMLVEARQTMEMFKTAELENYFQDDCVAALQATATSVDEISATAATVYPIILEDRVEMLLSLPTGMVRVVSPATPEQVLGSIEEYRLRLSERTFRYRRPAQELHDYLIAPVETILQDAGVDTLVLIPGGALRTIPFAALYDGQQHLVEKYALALAPGLSLLDPRPIRREKVDALMGGLSEGVQGFAPLPHVSIELRRVQDMFGGAVYKDGAFLTANIENALNSQAFTLVHLASHASFQADADSSFLLTYDGRMTMDALERFIKLSRFRVEPVELLTLSACETAVGDERAALGLAGVAIKAGARSALASLWLINDEAAAELVTEFYADLKDGNTSKAKALQRAQVTMLNDLRYRYPIYWAPFLLIGNWL